MTWSDDGNEMISLVYDELRHQTDMAYLLIFDQNSVWIPKSQSEIDIQEKTIDLKRWLVEEKGLEGYEE